MSRLLSAGTLTRRRRTDVRRAAGLRLVPGEKVEMENVLRRKVRSRGSAERTLALMKDCAIVGPNVDVAVHSVLGTVQSAEPLCSGIGLDRSCEDGVAAGR